MYNLTASLTIMPATEMYSAANHTSAAISVASARAQMFGAAPPTEPATGPATSTRMTRRLGFRTVRLQTDRGVADAGHAEGSGNSSMVFVVNGVHVLARGSSLAPLDSFNGMSGASQGSATTVRFPIHCPVHAGSKAPPRTTLHHIAPPCTAVSYHHVGW
jgi:hypothetical protein